MTPRSHGKTDSTPQSETSSQTVQNTVTERDLCALYGDHDECPFEEVDEEGSLTLCSCACHLFPGSAPE